jgi:hypothetical protein
MPLRRSVERALSPTSMQVSSSRTRNPGIGEFQDAVILAQFGNVV